VLGTHRQAEGDGEAREGHSRIEATLIRFHSNPLFKLREVCCADQIVAGAAEYFHVSF